MGQLQKTPPEMTELDEIVLGFADACFVSAWADAWDEHVAMHPWVERPWGPGAQIEAYAPKTPAHVVVWAYKQLQEIADANDVEIVALFSALAQREGHSVPPTRRDFGWYLAMQWLGHGVSWGDDHPDHGLELGPGEFHGHLENREGTRIHLYSTHGLDMLYIGNTGGLQ